MIPQAIAEAEERMKKAVAAVSKEFAAIRTGRATPALLDKVVVDYYGTKTPLNQLASISVPEPQLIVIQPWDKTAIDAVEKAILSSDLGLTPSNDGTVIRLTIPPLNEERRLELIKFVGKLAEEGRVSVRRTRREIKEDLEEKKKQGEISEDDLIRIEKQLQEVTDKYIDEIDKLLEAKKKEIMEV